MEGFLTMGYCFPYCFLEIFVGGQGLDGGGQSRDGVPQSPPPPLGKTLDMQTEHILKKVRQNIGVTKYIRTCVPKD